MDNEQYRKSEIYGENKIKAIIKWIKRLKVKKGDWIPMNFTNGNFKGEDERFLK